VSEGENERLEFYEKRRTQRFTGLHLSTNEAKSGDSTDIHGGLK